MKKSALLAAALFALVATSVFADESATTTTPARSADECAALFTKLDANSDGRISSTEAVTDARIASGFTATTVKQRGYLSKVDFDVLCQSTGTQQAQ